MRIGTAAVVAMVVALPGLGQDSRQAGSDVPHDARARAMQETLANLNKELQDHGGSYEKWGEALKPFRDAVRQAQKNSKWPWPAKDHFAFQGKEIALAMRDTLDSVPEGQRPPFDLVLETHKKLKELGVDLIFVPLPDKFAIYPDYLRLETPGGAGAVNLKFPDGMREEEKAAFAKSLGATWPPSNNVASVSAPEDRMVYPAVHGLMKKLLENDVEVVDLYPVFHAARKRSEAKPLYYAGDSHWRNNAAQLAAEKIAERLKRYDFVQKALAEEKRYSVQSEYRQDKPDQLMVVLDTKTGGRYADAAQSPILITGDSNLMYNMGARAGHMPAHIGLHIGMPLDFRPNTIPSQHYDQLAGKKVVIWANIARCLEGWSFPMKDVGQAKP